MPKQDYLVKEWRSFIVILCFKLKGWLPLRYIWNCRRSIYQFLNLCFFLFLEAKGCFLVVILYVMQKAKGTAAARKRVSEALKDFFSDPENRRKRSISMKGCLNFSIKSSLFIYALLASTGAVWAVPFKVGFLLVMQESNFTAEIVAVKGIEDTTALKLEIVQ